MTDKLRGIMKKKEIDAIIALSPENVHYLSGASSIPATIIRTFFRSTVLFSDAQKKTVLITDVGESDAVLSRGDSELDVRFYGRFYVERPKGTEGPKAEEDPFKAIRNVLNENGVLKGRVGIEEALIPLGLFNKLRGALPNISFVDATGFFEYARKIKSRDEVKKIIKAIEATEGALDSVLKQIKEGMTDIEVNRLFKTALASEGADFGFAFIASGTRSALPLIAPSENKIKMGDIIHFDVGGHYEGYHSDIGRTAVVGEPSRKQERIYSAVLAAQEKAIETIKPGVSVSKVYDAGVQGVREAGHPRFWRQHIGHGIGLEIHEAPSLADGKDSIEAGMVLAVEIPYYIIGVGGFRVEDILLVESDGCRLLSTIDREAIFSVGRE